MAKEKKKHKLLDAKELTRKRMEMKNLLVAHDVKGFRHYILKEGSSLMEAPVCAQYLKLNNEGISLLMHQIKVRQPYLGEAFQQSRNFFREQQLEIALADPATPLNEPLKAERELNGTPLCAECKYFRASPTEGEECCMRRGALPGDSACAGWTAL